MRRTANRAIIVLRAPSSSRRNRIVKLTMGSLFQKGARKPSCRSALMNAAVARAKVSRDPKSRQKSKPCCWPRQLAWSWLHLKPATS